MNVREVARILDVAPQRVHQLIDAKRLDARRIVRNGRFVRYDIRDAVVRNPPLRPYKGRRKAGK